jgi:hypothetical protein
MMLTIEEARGLAANQRIYFRDQTSLVEYNGTVTSVTPQLLTLNVPNVTPPARTFVLDGDGTRVIPVSALS